MMTVSSGPAEAGLSDEINDPGRLSSIIEACQARLRAFVSRRARPSEVDDVLQEVFANLVEADRANRVERVTSWLFRAVRNELIDRGRKRRELPLEDWEGGDPELAEISMIMGVPPGDPETDLLKSLFWRELALGLEELPEAQREVFVKTELEGVPFKALCRETGLPMGTLLARKHRAMVKLRRRLKEVRGLIMES